MLLAPAASPVGLTLLLRILPFAARSIWKFLGARVETRIAGCSERLLPGVY